MAKTFTDPDRLVWSRRQAGLVALACLAPSRVLSAPTTRLRLAAPAEMIEPLASALARFFEESAIAVELVSIHSRMVQDSLAQMAAQRIHAALLLDEPVVRPIGPNSIKLVAYDAIALIANGLNPVTSLSRAQIAQIYNSPNAQWPGTNKAVVRLVRDPDLPERKQFEQAMGITRVHDQGVHMVGGALASILFVAVDPLAIGYVSAALASQLAAQGARIKLLEVQGIAPTAANLRDGNYPMRRALRWVAPRAAGREVLRLADFMQGAHMREALQAAGYAPAPP